MNEVIGAKGGQNDRKRSLKITEQAKKNLQKYVEFNQQENLKQLEKKVKQNQMITFFKILPIITIGQTYTTLTEKTQEEKEKIAIQEMQEHINQSEIFSEPITKNINEKFEQQIEYLDQKRKETPLGITIIPKKEDHSTEYQIGTEEILKLDPLSNPSIETYPGTLSETKKVEVKEQQQTTIPIKETVAKRLDKLKNKAIVEEYETKLKDIRKDIRSTIFEYQILEEKQESFVNQEQTDEVMDKLTLLIQKVEQLKKKITIEEIDDYDKNYLYNLAEEYLQEFSHRNEISEIKDSKLYILLSDKIESLEKHKGFLKDKVETKKEELQIDEDKLEEIKDKYADFDKFSKELLQFQNEQDNILREMNQKLANAISIQEKIEVKIVGMRKQNERILKLIVAQMALPGARSAKGIATATLLSLYFMKNLMHPKTQTRKYKVINVQDYQKEIESSIEAMDGILTLLTKTSTEIDKVMENIEKEFKDYLDTIPECKKLLEEMKKIKSMISEKEYELERTKQQQQQNLEKNEAKVKTLQGKEI